MRIIKLFLLTATLTSTVVAQSAEWSQWRGPNRDGRVTAASLPQRWPKTLKEQWKVTVGVGHASPVVSDGKIYVFTRQGEEEVVLSLDAVTGKQIWKVGNPIAYEMNSAAAGHGKGPKSTPVVSNGNVYTFGITGVLSAHDARTGELKWRRDFTGNYPATSPLYGAAMSPLVEDGLVIVHVGGPDRGALRAFDVGRGAIKWSNNTDGPAYASPMVATLAGVRQVVSFMQKDLVGIDFANGRMLWRVPAKSGYDTNSVTPLIYKDMIIIAREDQGLTAFRLVKRGAELAPEEVWSNKQVELYMNTPVIEGNQLTGLSVRNKGQFFSIDADTGKTLWLGAGRMGENAAIVNAGGRVLLMLTNDAKLIVHSINAKEYAPAAQYTVAASQTWAHPLLFGKQILIKDLSTLTSFAIADK